MNNNKEHAIVNENLRKLTDMKIRINKIKKNHNQKNGLVVAKKRIGELENKCLGEIIGNNILIYEKIEFKKMI